MGGRAKLPLLKELAYSAFACSNSFATDMSGLTRIKVGLPGGSVGPAGGDFSRTSDHAIDWSSGGQLPFLVARNVWRANLLI